MTDQVDLLRKGAHYAEYPTPLTCPKCGAPMVRVRPKYGLPYWGCSSWPFCSGSIEPSSETPVPDTDHAEEAEP